MKIAVVCCIVLLALTWAHIDAKQRINSLSSLHTNSPVLLEREEFMAMAPATQPGNAPIAGGVDFVQGDVPPPSPPVPTGGGVKTPSLPPGDEPSNNFLPGGAAPGVTDTRYETSKQIIIIKNINMIGQPSQVSTPEMANNGAGEALLEADESDGEGLFSDGEGLDEGEGEGEADFGEGEGEGEADADAGEGFNMSNNFNSQLG